MSKSRRKSNGCRRNAFKLKRMGKGWSTLRRRPGRPLPVDRSESSESGESSGSSTSAESKSSDSSSKDSSSDS